MLSSCYTFLRLLGGKCSPRPNPDRPSQTQTSLVSPDLSAQPGQPSPVNPARSAELTRLPLRGSLDMQFVGNGALPCPAQPFP